MTTNIIIVLCTMCGFSLGMMAGAYLMTWTKKK